MRFNKGEWDKAQEVLFFDLEQLRDLEIKEDWNKTFDTLKGNLIDLYSLVECASCQSLIDPNSEDMINDVCLKCGESAK